MTDAIPSGSFDSRRYCTILIPVVIIFLCAFFARLAVTTSLRTLDAVPSLPAEVMYDAPAQSILHGEPLTGAMLDHYPGFTFFLTFAYKMFGVNYMAVRLMLYLISAITAVIIYFLARTLTTPCIGFIAGLAYALYPPLLVQGMYILPGPVFSFLILLALGYAGFFQQQYELKYGISFGFILACSAYFYPWIILLPVIYGIIYTGLYAKNSVANCLKLHVIPTAVSALIVVPWLLLLYTMESHTILLDLRGLLFHRSAWLDFLPRTVMRLPFYATWIVSGFFMLPGILVSYRNKLFMPYHAFLMTVLIIALVPGANVTFRPALYGVGCIYASAGVVVTVAKICSLAGISCAPFADQAWRYR